MDNITDIDTVLIMFSSLPRHDMVNMKNEWTLRGNIYTVSTYYKKDFFKKYWSPLQGLYLSWSSIISCVSLLDTVGCNYKLMKAFDLTFTHETNDEVIFESNDYVDIIKNELQTLLPNESLFEFSKRVDMIPYTINGCDDLHPTVKIHGEWVRDYLPEYWDKKTEQFVIEQHKLCSKKYKKK